MRRASRTICLAALAWCLPAFAEITLDGTLGPTGAQSGDMVVVENMGTRAGANLFHSFGILNINEGETLTFLADAPTDNLIGRVTGGTPSLIDGLLSTSSITGASFWLINPAGLVMGPNAVLDIAGTFNVGTADEVVMADGSRFSATDPQSSTLTIADPVGFGFLDANAGAIDLNGVQLDAPGGINLIGGDVSVDGSTVTTSGGRFGIASTASAGDVLLGANGFSLDGVSQRGDASLSGSLVESGGGAVFITANGFVMTDSNLTSIVSDTVDAGPVSMDVDTLTLTGTGDGFSGILTQTFGAGAAAPVTVTAAESVTLDPGSIQSISEAGATGDAGDVTVSTGQFLQRFSFMGIFTAGEGRGGTLRVNASDSVRLEGGFGTTFASNSLGGQPAGNVYVNTPDLSFDGGSLLARALASGDGGSINLDVGTLTMSNGTQFVAGAFSTGAGGDINVTADTIFMTGDVGYPTGMFSGANEGPGGRISVDTRVLDIEDGAELSVTSFGSAAAGSIDVDASERVSITGRPGQVDVERVVFTGIFSNGFAGGSAGNINVETPLLELASAGSIQASTRLQDGGGAGGSINLDVGRLSIAGGQGPGVQQGSFVSAMSFGDGAAGDINITADDIELSGDPDSFDGIFARAVRNGTGGNILIDTGSLEVGRFATVDASALASGDAGDLTIRADRVSVVDGGAIAVATIGTGSAGSVTLAVDGPLSVTGRSPDGAVGSRIESSSLAADGGAAGNVNISAASLTLADGGQIRAETASSVAANPPATVDLAITGATDLSGTAVSEDLASGIFARTTGAAGGGDVNLVTGSLAMADNSVIRSGTRGSGRGGDVSIDATAGIVLSDAAAIRSTGTADGDAGGIGITTPSLSMSGGLISASAEGAGDGGHIVIAAEDASLDQGARITSSSSGTGAAGSLDLSGSQLVLENDSSLDTNAEVSSGGNITLTYDDLVELVDSRIDAAASGVTADSNGGNVTIDPEFVVLNRSEVLASANAGNGGNILIRANFIYFDFESVVDASSQTGVDGDVLLESPNELADTIIDIETPPFETVDVVRNACAARALSGISSLVVEQTAVTGIRPDGFLPTPVASGGPLVAAVTECRP